MRATFVEAHQEAADIHTFWFRPTQNLHYTAGQFVEITIPHKADARGQKHWFTLSSSPTDELISITTRIVPDSSSFKRQLLAMQPHQTVQISEAMGDFVLPKDPTLRLVFVAAGMGITPYHSIIKWLLDSGQKRNIQLIFVARNEKDFVFQELFESYGLNPIHILTSTDTAPFTSQRILDIAPDDGKTYYYLSGPEPMIESLVDQFKGTTVPAERLVTDYFPGYLE
jgi:ferredoxin-NADP reductase